MAANKLVVPILLPLLSAALLNAQAAPPPAPLELGGLAHLAAPGFAGNPAGEGCVIVRAAAERATEERRDCAAPRPPWRGQVFEWLETPGAISLFPAVLAAGAAEPPPLLFGERGTVLLSPPDPAAVVDFFQLDSFRASRSPRPDFRRRAGAAEAAHGVALPAGLVFAAVRGPAGTMLARPARLEPGAALILTPATPAAGRADLLLVLNRSRPLRIYDRDHEVALQLARGRGETRQPDQLVASGDRVIALFYDLPAGSWQLQAESAAYEPALEPLELRGGQAKIASFDLRPLPSLVARLEMPAALRNTPLLLQAFDLASGEKLADLSGIDPRSEQVNLGFLPAALVELRLEAEAWLFKELADLRPREDREVRFAPQPIAVSGTVTRDGRPFETYVTFSPGGSDRPEAIPTDGGGRYETLLFKSGLYPVIVEMGAEKPAYIQEVTVPETTEATFDFEVPDNAVRVVVVDAESQEAVPSPNIYLEVSGDVRPMKFQFTAGSEGTFDLPPLPAGQMVISASAALYLRSPPQAFDVAQLGSQHELRILLEKALEPKLVTFVGPDGAPAAGIEVRAQGGLDDTTPTFEGWTDDRGQLEMPAQTDSLYLLWRDPSGRLASGFATYLSDDDRFNPRIQLSPAAFLAVQVIDRGETPLPNTPLLLWAASGEQVEGEALQFLHGAKESDAAGYFRARGLPAAPVILLAFSPGRKHFELKPLATQIDWPWPATVLLERVD